MCRQEHRKTASLLPRTRPTTDLVTFRESAHQYIIHGGLQHQGSRSGTDENEAWKDHMTRRNSTGGLEELGRRGVDMLLDLLQNAFEHEKMPDQ